MPECPYKKRLKKLRIFVRVLCFILPLLISVELVAQIRPAGLAPFGKKLFCIQTEYFDFIFPEESAASARILASRADDFYREICDRLEVSDIMRKALSGMPVFITRETEALNAYFTAVPYNRIVLYDSVPPASFAVFSDTLLSVFYHELVHAVSLNIKSPFWYGFSRAAGDVYSPSLLLNMPTSFIEGAAVSFESLDGEGRLNDSYSMHVIRQAKLEGKFPDWRTAAGSYSAYTDGSLHYIFGAAFADYLQKTYGMHPYAEFWKQSGRTHFFKLAAGIFKKVYGISLKQAWNDFEQSVELPCGNLPAPEATALFPENSTEDKDAVKGRHLYTSLTFAQGTLAWYDAASSSVWKVRMNADGTPAEKPFFLYTTDLSERLTFSREGDFLVSSGLRGGVKAQSFVSVYDVKKGAIAAEVSGLRSAVIIRAKDGRELLAGLRRDDGVLSLVLYDLQSLLRSANDGAFLLRENPPPLHTIPFGRTSFPFDVCDAGDGRLVCLVKDGKTGASPQTFAAETASVESVSPEGTGFFYRLFFYDLESSRPYSYGLSSVDGFSPALHSLSVCEGKAFFSCSLKPKFQPVLARTDLALFKEPSLEGGSGGLEKMPVLSVQKEQYSGGVFFPVILNDGAAFVSRFYEHRRLSGISEASLEASFQDCQRFSFVPCKAADIQFPLRIVPAVQSAGIRPYRAVRYLKKGTIVPFAGFLNAAFFDRYAPDTQPLGLSAFSGDPAERFLLAAGAGIDPITQSYNINAFASAASGRFGFAAGFYTQADWNKSSLQKAAVKLYTDFQLPVGLPFTYIYGGNSAYFFYTFSKTPFLPAGYVLENKTELALRFVKKTGIGVYETLGFTGGFFILNSNNREAIQNMGVWRGSHAFETGIQLPFLLPFKNPRGFTLNLPAAFNAVYYINAFRVWDLGSRAVLFSYNMQKPLPLIPAFIREITLDGGADYTLFYNNTSLLYIHSSLFLVCSLNSGSATGVPFDIGVSLKWRPPDMGPENFKLALKFNLKL